MKNIHKFLLFGAVLVLLSAVYQRFGDNPDVAVAFDWQAEIHERPETNYLIVGDSLFTLLRGVDVDTVLDRIEPFIPEGSRTEVWLFRGVFTPAGGEPVYRFENFSWPEVRTWR